MQQVAQLSAPRRDPAPSRTAYRIQRLWLRPAVREFTRKGLPFLVIAIFATSYFADASNREALSLKYTELRRAFQERPEFMVKLMAVDGASDALATEIRAGFPVLFPVTAFDLDLEEMRSVVADMGAVADVDVNVRGGGVLQITVKERVPAAVWRARDGVRLLDVDGKVVTQINARIERPDLPLIAGDGADKHMSEAWQLLAAAAPLNGRLRGLVRMGERRWDVVLDRGQRILLPEDRPVTALERVIALSKAQDMLGRDLTIIDMRNEQRPTIRMAANAIEALRRIKTVELGE